MSDNSDKKIKKCIFAPLYTVAKREGASKTLRRTILLAEVALRLLIIPLLAIDVIIYFVGKSVEWHQQTKQLQSNMVYDQSAGISYENGSIADCLKDIRVLVNNQETPAVGSDAEEEEVFGFNELLEEINDRS